MTAGWWDGPLVALDLETTAPDPETARIVTAAFVIVGPLVHADGSMTPELTPEGVRVPRDVQRRTWLADPGVPIPEGATAVHGVTTEHARKHGQDLGAVVQELTEAIADAPAGAPVVIFNARFDWTVLDRAVRGQTDHGIDELVNVFRPTIDPLVLDKHLDRYRRGSRKLEAVCQHYGATLDGAHDAAHDAIAAARVAWCIGARGHVVRQARGPRERDELAALEAEWSRVHNDLAALHDAQKRWAAEQAAGLADYFRSQGKADEAESVRGEWPLVPFEATGGRRAA